MELLPIQITDGVAVNDVAATFGWKAVMVTLEESAQAPLVIFHLKTFAPVPKPVTVVVGLVGVVIVPLPLTSDQVPEPTEGVFVAMVAVAHTVWLGPAFASVTLASIV